MAYSPKDWKNLPDETTPIEEEDMNRIEQKIKELDEKSETVLTFVVDTENE